MRTSDPPPLQARALGKAYPTAPANPATRSGIAAWRRSSVPSAKAYHWGAADSQPSLDLRWSRALEPVSSLIEDSEPLLSAPGDLPVERGRFRLGEVRRSWWGGPRMVTTEAKRLFCDSLGIDLAQVKVERISDPERRAHLLFRVSHPWFGEGVAQLEHDAWHAFFDAAEKKPPLPDRCQARTKKGSPCQNAPQKGEQYCGPHLDLARRTGGA